MVSSAEIPARKIINITNKLLPIGHLNQYLLQIKASFLRRKLGRVEHCFIYKTRPHQGNRCNPTHHNTII